MYAIVDIETTGGHAAANSITEIAIRLHDGIRILSSYQTLINPLQPIPPFIQSYTGITDEMVHNAPTFDEVADEIFEMLSGNIFVAHSVNFDYSFIKQSLLQSGYTLNCKKLCTVRLSRKIFPGYPSYSLGNLCQQLNIPIENRHRAGGDADATCTLFSMLHAHDANNEISKTIKSVAELYLPPNIDKKDFEALPLCPGVYYFHNQAGKIIYVGKAKNLRKRVASHFSNNSPGLRKQEYIKKIFHISFEALPDEITAMLLESVEIKKWWPELNRSQKNLQRIYGAYDYTDHKGRLRIGIDIEKKNIKPILKGYSVNGLLQQLNDWQRKYELCPKLAGILEGESLQTHTCVYCTDDIEFHNQKINEAMEAMMKKCDSFVLVRKHYDKDVHSCIMVDNNVFYGMAVVDELPTFNSKEEIKSLLTHYKNNSFADSLVYRLRDSGHYQCIDLST